MRVCGVFFPLISHWRMTYRVRDVSLSQFLQAYGSFHPVFFLRYFFGHVTQARSTKAWNF